FLKRKLNTWYSRLMMNIYIDNNNNNILIIKIIML
uniref:Uncharacterized protein n=1 Tax=Amphimedon queenslandica TaxID=400682 RepID=A0A1X7V1V7_AMPQE